MSDGRAAIAVIDVNPKQTAPPAGDAHACVRVAAAVPIPDAIGIAAGGSQAVGREYPIRSLAPGRKDKPAAAYVIERCLLGGVALSQHGWGPTDRAGHHASHRRFWCPLG